MINGIIVMVVIKLVIQHVNQDILDHYVYNVIYIIREGLDTLESKINNVPSVMMDIRTMSTFCYQLFGKCFRCH